MQFLIQNYYQIIFEHYFIQSGSANLLRIFSLYNRYEGVFPITKKGEADSDKLMRKITKVWHPTDLLKFNQYLRNSFLDGPIGRLKLLSVYKQPIYLDILLGGIK
jgi:hypothetical protein